VPSRYLILIRKDILPKIKYLDGTDDYEYVIFSRNLRASGVPQYLDNQQIYGYLSTRENLEACKEKMENLKWEQQHGMMLLWFALIVVIVGLHIGAVTMTWMK